MSTTTVPAITEKKAPEDFDDPVELAEHISERFGVPWSHLERLGDLITWLHMGLGRGVRREHSVRGSPMLSKNCATSSA